MASTKNIDNSPVLKWLQDHANYPHEDYCLIWPFATFNGYGTFICDGKKAFAHRYMCEMKNGPAPSPDHQAAHSCNRGRFGCVNPHHVRWKTQSENLLEAPKVPKLKLSLEQAMQIRAMKGRESIGYLAKRYGITECSVRDIQDGRTWKDETRRKRFLQDDEVRRIRSSKGDVPAKKLAADFNLPVGTVYKIWAGVAWQHVEDKPATQGQR